MKKKLLFLLFIFSFIYGCNSVGINDLSKDNSSESAGGSTETAYTVTFNANGGTGNMPLMEIKSGEVKTLPLNTFYRADYTFTGWSLSANSNSVVYLNGSEISTERNITLYACWNYTGTGSGGTETPDTSIKYTVTFNNNGGSGFMGQITIEKGKSAELPQNTYTKDGFSFAGWSRTENGAVEYNDRQVISVTENITLYAVWNPVKQYKITYHSNTAVDEIKETYKFSPSGGSVVYLDANEFTNGSKKFTGWSKDKAGTNGEYQDRAPLSVITEDMELYAVWADNPVTISFSANGGVGTMPNLYAKAGDKIILPEATFTNDGYDLKGLMYQSSLDVHKYYFFNSEYTVTDEDITFSVLWVEQPRPDDPIRGGNSDTYRNMDVWVDGLVVKDSDYVESTIKGIKYIVRNENSGWYDVDQSFFNLCWAGAASNLLHWWYDRNKENIEKYFAEYASPDKEKPNMEYVGWGTSRIFNYFVMQWPNNGYLTDKGLIWYLIGGGIRANGAFFEEVLGDKTDFVEVVGALNQYKLNTALDKAFKNKMAIAGSETNMSGPHGITIWGAHFDENGLVDRIYVSDSATTPGSNTMPKVESGILPIDIVYSFDSMFGRVYMKTYMGGLIPLNSITLLSNTHDKWEEYFKTHSPRQK